MGTWEGMDTAPTKEYLLREEYPDLKEKWVACQNHKQDFLDTLAKLEKFGIIKRFFKPEEYRHAIDNCVETKTLYENALKEYEILEKLLWNY